MALPQQLNEAAIAASLEHYFQALAAGDDQSPAERFRLEGYLLAAVQSGQHEREALQALIAQLSSRYLSTTTIVADTTRHHPDPGLQLPWCMHRAPVVPTTAED